MGRTQTFDTERAVQAARDVFWDKGFEGTSLPDLEDATGLSRSSLYHAFTSKRGLFDAAIQNYLDTVIRPRLRLLTAQPTPPDALQTYFAGLSRAIATLPDDSPRRGCLLLNSAGLASHDEALRAVVDSYRAELGAAVEGALRAAHPGMDAATISTRGRLLTSLSVSALLVARINRDEAVAILATALDQIEGWVREG
jgi:TetR/AcrR family transcriptional repressor of nem operon